MKTNILKNFLSAIVFLSLAIIFIIKFAMPPVLKSYIKAGIGDCQTIPILCMTPSSEIINPQVQQTCLIKLIPSNDWPDMSVCVPKGFTVVKERIKKIYYKKSKRPIYDNVIYLLYEKPQFFMGLFPQLKKAGVNNDYEFIKRTMYATLPEVNTLTDAFFIIIKGIFIPDLGNQKDAHMAQFTIQDKYGFINYSLNKDYNYFDCDIFNKEGSFFKVYIKDKGATLDLNSVYAIISTVKTVP